MWALWFDAVYGGAMSRMTKGLRPGRNLLLFKPSRMGTQEEEEEEEKKPDLQGEGVHEY